MGFYDAMKEKIMEKGSSFTPFVAGVYSDELRYEQIIAIMDYLDADKKIELCGIKEEMSEEEVVLMFYHKHAASQALALDFNSSFVRSSFCQKRKLKLLDEWKERAGEAALYAKHAVKILDPHKS